jgi:hypothetical protein
MIQAIVIRCLHNLIPLRRVQPVLLRGGGSQLGGALTVKRSLKIRCLLLLRVVHERRLPVEYLWCLVIIVQDLDGVVLILPEVPQQHHGVIIYWSVRSVHVFRVTGLIQGA